MCEDETYPLDVVLGGVVGTHRILVRLRTYRGRLVDYALQHEWRSEWGGDWKPVFRIDTRHGCIHSHQYHRDGARETRPIQALGRNDRAILEESYETSYTQVFDWMEQHFRSWQR
ncbi:hypothetical protein DRB07_08975 [Actinomyces sp. Z3]|nr:hypothetical protein DRB07_08975 [Actinomyces sp. Z3]